VGASGKMRVLDRLLLKLHAKGHRVVLFSQFSSMVDLLDDYCTMRGFNFVRLTGSTNRVQRMVNLQAFNAPGSKVGLSLSNPSLGPHLTPSLILPLALTVTAAAAQVFLFLMTWLALTLTLILTLTLTLILTLTRSSSS